jgi:hypothetical protein
MLLADAIASQQKADQAAANGPNGYPENTPLAEMTIEQQLAYWKHHARQHEARWKSMSDYEQIKAKLAEIEAANMTEQQKAVAEAEKRGRQAALEEAGSKLVEQFFRAVLTNRKTEDEIQAIVGPLDKSSFLTADGLSVDTDKVVAFANVVAPPQPAQPAPAPSSTPAAPGAPATPATGTTRKVPDMGQGPTDPVKPTGLAAGKAIAEARYGKKTTTAA